MAAGSSACASGKLITSIAPACAGPRGRRGCTETVNILGTRRQRRRTESITDIYNEQPYALKGEGENEKSPPTFRRLPVTFRLCGSLPFCRKHRHPPPLRHHLNGGSGVIYLAGVLKFLYGGGSGTVTAAEWPRTQGSNGANLNGCG